MFCRGFTIPKTANIKNKFTACLYICGSVCHQQGTPVRSGPDSMQLVYIYCCPSYVIRPLMWLCDSVYSPALPIYAINSRFKGVLKGFGRLVWVCIGCVLCVLYWLILRVRS